ncbi:MAG: alpha-glucan family phosphorylase [Bacteriovoracaceae bacterium]
MNLTNLPEKFAGLNDIAHNLWWSWNQESWELFETLNSSVWNEKRNPVKTLSSATGETWKKLENDEAYVALYNKVSDKFQNYMNRPNTWFNGKYADHAQKRCAYFCTEYGLHESLPIYSGGLGVLAGDHVKSSSDLGIPMLFVGLFYRNGYFTQQINNAGDQVDVYETFDPEVLPVNPALTKNGTQAEVEVELPGRKVKAQVWEVQAGINTLYLLDSHHRDNTEEDKLLTSRLYGGDREMRISQEILLGIGGVKALKALEIEPAVFHMNEGHSGFFQLERVLNLMEEKNISFEEARTVASSNCVFTTHTPVPAGNESFSLPMMHEFFHTYIKKLNISWNRFISLGLVDEKSDYKFFSLTVFALNFSRFQNGVSELHGKIAAKMWKSQWPNVPEIDNSITHITNGVHVQTWTSLEAKELFETHMGANWEDELANQEYWDGAHKIPNTDIATKKKALKGKMIKMVRTQLKEQLQRNGEAQNEIDAVDSYLSEDALTIGFARRFATYKRATLIFKDKERLRKIISNTDKPVQFIFAGKAHPADVPGQNFIREIYKISREEEFKGKVIILENYDMNISRHMVSGVDVWLNNPRRPMEASGTSGQKVPLNFGLNFSVLDGWWREGHNGNNGWTIGEEKDYPNDDVQDFEDANDFYCNLEETIAPLYYDNNDEWINKSKESLVSNIARFSTHRMVQDYMNNLYAGALDYSEIYNKEDLQSVEKYNETRRFFQRHWEYLTFQEVGTDGQIVETVSDYNKTKDTPSHHVEFSVDQTLPGRVFETSQCQFNVSMYLGDIAPEELGVELVITDEKSAEFRTLQLENKGGNGMGIGHYEVNFKSDDNRPRRIRLRAYPKFKNLCTKFEYGLISWY